MKALKLFSFAVLGAAVLASCDRTNPETAGLTAQDKELKAAVEQYVPGVIYKTYGNLADATEVLYNQLSAMKSSSAYTLSLIHI